MVNDREGRKGGAREEGEGGMAEAHEDSLLPPVSVQIMGTAGPASHESVSSLEETETRGKDRE